MEELIKSLELSSQLMNDYHLFNAVSKNLYIYDVDKLIDLSNEWCIQKKCIKIQKVENDGNYYEKYCLFENESFSLILIRWNKDSFSKIHDHPDKGCIMRVLKGSLKEETYTPKLNLISTNLLKEDKIGYKKGNKILHKIIALQESISLHVYIPGNYKTNYY